MALPLWVVGEDRVEARSPTFWPLNSDSALANSNMRTGSLSSGMRGLKRESCFFTSLSGRICKHVLLVLCEKGRQVDGRAGVEEGVLWLFLRF